VTPHSAIGEIYGPLGFDYLILCTGSRYNLPKLPHFHQDMRGDTNTPTPILNQYNEKDININIRTDSKISSHDRLEQSSDIRSLRSGPVLPVHDPFVEVLLGDDIESGLSYNSDDVHPIREILPNSPTIILSARAQHLSKYHDVLVNSQKILIVGGKNACYVHCHD
jgi:hypothetical protein